MLYRTIKVSKHSSKSHRFTRGMSEILYSSNKRSGYETFETSLLQPKTLQQHLDCKIDNYVVYLIYHYFIINVKTFILFNAKRLFLNMFL